jgi:purine-nucleoside phosphorylase
MTADPRPAIELSLAPAHAAARHWLGDRTPTVAIVLGSGLGELTGRLGEASRLPYDRIPGFPEPGVAGHAGELVAGTLGGRVRFHAYEGHGPATIALPVRLFARLGIRVLILTNAAGGIHRRLRPGASMLIADHLNLSFRNPLIGRLLEGESRFPDMSAPYDAALREAALAVARAERVALEEGVYAGVPGPSYETPAEIRMLARMGADAVGMSTVLEVIAARAAGMRCLGISTITNAAAGISPTPLSHAEVMLAARGAGEALGRVISGVVAGLDGP